MRTPHEIESMARQIRFEPDASADNRILRAAEAVLDTSRETARADEARPKGRYGMQLRIAKWAVAALILVALGIHFLGGSIDGASVTLADVLEQIRDFRPYRCRYSVAQGNQSTDVRTVEQFSLTLRREVHADGSITVIDLATPKILTLHPEEKEAHEHWPDIEPKRDLDLLALVNLLQGGTAEAMGATTLEGHTVVGFHAILGSNDMTLWADVHTKLPVLFEIIHVGQGRTITMDQFEFEVPFDSALFGTTAPAGYTVKKTGKGHTSMAHVGEGLPEEPLLTGLKAVAEALDGVFPPAIELPKLQETLRQYSLDHKLSDEEKEKGLLPVSDYWTRAVWYLNQLQHGTRVKDLQWRGEGVRLGDGTTAIMWWQYPDAPTYRVIYGDLTIKDLGPQELPQ